MATSLFVSTEYVRLHAYVVRKITPLIIEIFILVFAGELRFHNNDITGTVPTELGDMTDLGKLSELSLSTTAMNQSHGALRRDDECRISFFAWEPSHGNCS